MTGAEQNDEQGQDDRNPSQPYSFHLDWVGREKDLS